MGGEGRVSTDMLIGLALGIVAVAGILYGLIFGAAPDNGKSKGDD